jgi:hypothetical protein
MTHEAERQGTTPKGHSYTGTLIPGTPCYSNFIRTLQTPMSRFSHPPLHVQRYMTNELLMMYVCLVVQDIISPLLPATRNMLLASHEGNAMACMKAATCYATSSSAMRIHDT